MAREPLSRGMRAALRAAQRGAGQVSPNPLVGAAVETPDGRIRSAGHLRFGAGHAEARLLDASPLPRGSILYVTLEPCNHQGKTPPCTESVIAARPSRVVVATLDPDPRVRGTGVARLRAAGIAVEVGQGEEEALRGNLAFHLFHARKRALICLKLASSLDGRLAADPGAAPGRRAAWITGIEARTEVHRERARADAVLTGSGTVLADDPRLTVRHVRGPDPSRIVVDSSLRTPAQCRLWRAWRDSGGMRAGPEKARSERFGNFRRGAANGYRRVPRLVLATVEGHDPGRLAAYAGVGWEIWELPAARAPRSGGRPAVPPGKAGTGDRRGTRVSLPALARRAGREGLLRLFAECGPGLAGGLLAEGLADELSLYVAPVVLGGRWGWPEGFAAPSPARAPGFDASGAEFLGRDLHVRLLRTGRIETVRFEAR